jgi:hypothetical protein
MPQIKITLLLDIPEGTRIATPDVDYEDGQPYIVEPQQLPPWPAPTYDRDEIARPVAVSAPGCPQHGAMTRFPAGTNKAGKAYNASWRCAVKDCPTKPIWDRDAA